MTTKTKTKIETIDFIESEELSYHIGNVVKYVTRIESEELSYHIGNVVKYVTRAGHKDGLLQDLQRARWYLDREIQRLSKAKDE